jgi:hypothetical protein
MVQGTPYIDTTTGDFKYQGTSGTPAVLAKADGSVHLVPLIHPFGSSTGVQSSGIATFTGIGTIVFDPSSIFSTNGKITRSISFQAVLEVSASVTGEIQLYNISTGAVVTGSLLSSSTASPTLLTGTLTIGASPNLPNSQQIYEVQIRISSPGSPSVSDRVVCKNAQIIVVWS